MENIEGVSAVNPGIQGWRTCFLRDILQRLRSSIEVSSVMTKLCFKWDNNFSRLLDSSSASAIWGIGSYQGDFVTFDLQDQHSFWVKSFDRLVRGSRISVPAEILRTGLPPCHAFPESRLCHRVDDVSMKLLPAIEERLFMAWDISDASITWTRSSSSMQFSKSWPCVAKMSAKFKIVSDAFFLLFSLGINCRFPGGDSADFDELWRSLLSCSQKMASSGCRW